MKHSRPKAVWHPGTEVPREDMADCAVLLVQLKDDVLADLPAFFCFYDHEKEEPWGVVSLAGYNVRFSNSDVERWMYLDELIERKK